MVLVRYGDESLSYMLTILLSVSGKFDNSMKAHLKEKNIREKTNLIKNMSIKEKEIHQSNIEKRHDRNKHNRKKIKIGKRIKKMNRHLKSKKINNMRNFEKSQRNYTVCLEKFIEYSRVNELKARSIEMQVNRINSFKGIQDKKKDKKGNFKGTYNTLLSALGGNESAPECDGKPLNTTRGAKYKGKQ